MLDATTPLRCCDSPPFHFSMMRATPPLMSPLSPDYAPLFFTAFSIFTLRRFYFSAFLLYTIRHIFPIFDTSLLMLIFAACLPLIID